MSDNGDLKGAQSALSEDLKASIVIMQKTNGEIRVSAPFGETIFCLGLLEQAKDIVKAAAAEILRKQNNIVKPHGIMNFVRGGKR